MQIAGTKKKVQSLSKLHFFFHISENDTNGIYSEETRHYYGYLEKVKEQRIWAPMFDLMYHLAISRTEFMKMGRKEMEYHFKRLNEEISRRNDSNNKNGGGGGKDIVAANDPTVQALMPNPSGRQHVNPRTHRI
jgi:hypothetical protein